MENTTTARIDMQRLQLLNDRLCQTLDALNQVRISAHNIGTANPFLAGYGYNTAYNPTLGYAPAFVNPAFGYNSLPTVANPWMTGSAVNAWNPFYTQGIGQIPGAHMPFTTPYVGGYNPAFTGYVPSYTPSYAPSYAAGFSPYTRPGMMGMDATRTQFTQPVGF